MYPQNGKTFKSTDSGKTWNEVEIVKKDIGATLIDMNFPDSMNGWAASHLRMQPISSLVKTTDGGASWSAVSIPESVGAYFRIFSLDANTAWILGAVSLKTINGGTSWVAF